MNEWCSHDLLEDSKDFSVTTEGEKQVVQGEADAKLNILTSLSTFPNSPSSQWG